MEFKTSSRKVIFFSGCFLFLSLAIFAKILYDKSIPTESVCRIPTPYDIPKNHVRSESAMKGRQIFNNYCAACHKLSARATGTALRGVDSTVYSNWMKVEKREFDTIRFKELGVEYHRYLASELNTLEIRNIYQYTKPISN